MNVLVTGGAGYIGSHAALRLLVDGHGVTVVDNLSRGHLGAIDALESVGRVHFVEGEFGDEAELNYNIGIGSAYSVRQVIGACRVVTGVDFPAVEGRRRQGDPPMLCADPAKIRRERGWRARTGDLQKIIDTAWRWRRQHPEGYGR